MTTIWYVFLALLVFGLFVFVHEMGHFLAARATGIGVKEFALGFGPKIVSFVRKGTRYSLRWIPMGGFCRFYDEGEDMDREDAFPRQKVWKRMIVVAAGPVMNGVLAYAALVLFLLVAQFWASVPLVQEVMPGSGAEAAGMLAGDRIVQVRGEEIPYTVEGTARMMELIQMDPGTEVPITVEREGTRTEMNVAARKTDDRYQIGIVLGAEPYRYSFGQAVTDGAVQLKNITKAMVDMLIDMFSTGEGLKDTMGAVGMVSVMTETVQQGFDMVLNMIVMISLNIGIVNLLPVPALDGGHLLLLLVEAIIRRPLNKKLEMGIQAAGLVLIFGLFILITCQDILRLITK